MKSNKFNQILRKYVVTFVVLLSMVCVAIYTCIGCATNQSSTSNNPNSSNESVLPDNPNDEVVEEEPEDSSTQPPTENETVEQPDNNGEVNEEPPVTDSPVAQPDNSDEVTETPTEEEIPTVPPVEEEPTPEEPPVEDTEPEPPVIEDKEPIKVYFVSPLEYTSIGMGYTENGLVYNQTTKSWTLHYAVDLMAESGTQVKAMFDGVVLEVEENDSLGCMVKIDHGENVVITYASLNSCDLVVGQTIKQGDIIGEVGITLNNEITYGNHLHLEIAVNGVSVNPTPYIDGSVYREVEQD